jgi:hypothetical protein
MSSDDKTNPKVCPTDTSDQYIANSVCVEDLPPSYALAMFRETVHQTIQNQRLSDNKDIVVIEQPISSSVSPDLSKRDSLASTELILNAETIKKERPVILRPESQAWSETIVIKNLHERDRLTILCFCVSTLSGIFSLAFFCSAWRRLLIGNDLGIILALSWHYLGIILALSWHYLDTTLTLLIIPNAIDCSIKVFSKMR